MPDTAIGGLPQTLNFMTPCTTYADNPYYQSARNLVQLIMMGYDEKLVEKVDWYQSLHNMTWGISRDHRLISRALYQQGFKSIFLQLKEMDLASNPSARRQAELYISNCLSYFSFHNLNPYEFISVPQWIDNEWQLVDYKIHPIELTPKQGMEALFIRDQDRLFAYGLEPILNQKAEPHLVFMGTAIGGGQGLLSQLHTDLEPFETPGKRMYRYGLPAIQAFLDKQVAFGRKTHVCGMSLGGALSLLVAIHQGEKLSRVDALNPPGLYEPFRKSRFDRWDELCQSGQAPQVCVQKQGEDEVSSYGNWKKEFQVWHVQAPEDKKGPEPFFDHTLNYAGFSETIFTSVDPEKDNQDRKFRNRTMFIGFRFFLYAVFLAPIYYFFRPLVSLIYRHSVELLLLSVSLCALPFVGMPLSLCLGAVALFAALVICFDVIFDIIHALYQFFSQGKIEAHQEHEARVKEMDLHTHDDTMILSKDILNAYYSLFGLFTPKSSIDIDNEYVQITDSKARIYLLKQFELTDGPICGLTLQHIDSIRKEANQEYINARYACI